MTIMTSEHLLDLQIQSITYGKLMELFPAKIRKEIAILGGLSNSQLCELVIAQAKGTYVFGKNKQGMDFGDGSEGKFATVTEIEKRETKNGILYIYPSRRASIGNLKNKTGDIHAIIADPWMNSERTKCEDVSLRFFTFPYKVWSTKVPGNKFFMDFTNDSHKWYMDYEVSKKEFFA